ncbi:MAG: DegV family EDD domain-containing protein [Lachnospiraceae bacterium]|nr:DegV family EDD domain-containing protein [Lachnospiraceae bacterium]
MKSLKSLWEKRIGSDKSFEQYNIVFMAIIAEISIFIALLVDIFIHEHIVEIMTLIVTLLVIPVSSYVFVKRNMAKFGSRVQTLFLVVAVLPVSFVWGGGPRGGGIVWTAFAFMYVGIMLSGIFRRFMTTLISLMVIAEYTFYHLYPRLIYQHTEMQMCIDSAVSVLLVGFDVYLMVWFQKQLFREENRRAKAETKRAEELNRSQSQFFSSMSHEIRTPINSILGLNELILRDDTASDEIRKDASNIQGSGRMLLALVNDILDISKIEAGKMDIVPVNYNLGDMISEIVNMIWLRADQKGLKFEVDIDPALPAELFGDEVRVKQILINILNNAIKYTKEGSVTLHMECEEVIGDQVLILFSISDTGMGIKKDALPHLFDAFQRVDEEKNRHIEGTGLGLSIVKQLIELMDGEIKVSSVYTQGSTFTIYLKQGISGDTKFGAVNLANYGKDSASSHYEASFTADQARILIVDDNEMNLDVEKKLLVDTKIVTDTVTSGADALDMTLTKRYDVILMDHLMPEMDGLECFSRIRKQKGGLNNQTPIIVLTANAGGENRELYSRTGFDDYLVKPVSGKQLEDLLLKHLPDEKIVHTYGEDISKREMNTAKGYSRKKPVLITTSTMCDLPMDVLEELQVEVIPFLVHMDDKVYWDGLEASTDDLVHYLNDDSRKIDSEPPSVEDYELFFANKLKKAHQIIHIALTTSMSEEYDRAYTAAKAFDNVQIVNSEFLSSTTGLMVLIAAQMAQRNELPDKIIEELDSVKSRLHCSFVIAETHYMMRRGFISKRLDKFMLNLSLRPCLKIKDDKFGVAGILMGNRKACYMKYIKKALPKMARPDTDILFITYVDVYEDVLLMIEEEVRKHFDFKHIIFQKASAAISLNCGPGTFGLLYMDKGKYSYDLGSYFELEDDIDIAEEEEFDLEENANMVGLMDASALVEETKEVEKTEPMWYDSLEGIDGAIAIKNSGSEDAFKSVLGIFYESIDDKSKELESFYENEDWDNYTIKVHALKSSAKLIGAMELSDAAKDLEMAGKASDIDFIKAHHEDLITDYLKYQDTLSEICAKKVETDKPVADMFLMETVYEAAKEAAEALDCDMLDEVFDELNEYSIPVSEQDKYEAIKRAADSFDYEGIIKILS